MNLEKIFRIKMSPTIFLLFMILGEGLQTESKSASSGIVEVNMFLMKGIILKTSFELGFYLFLTKVESSSF